MHRSLRLLVGTLLVLLPVSASADTLAINSSTLGLSIGALPPVTIPGTLSSLAVSSGAGTFTEPQGAFGPATVTLPLSLRMLLTKSATVFYRPRTQCSITSNSF